MLLAHWKGVEWQPWMECEKVKVVLLKVISYGWIVCYFCHHHSDAISSGLDFIIALWNIFNIPLKLFLGWQWKLVQLVAAYWPFHSLLLMLLCITFLLFLWCSTHLWTVQNPIHQNSVLYASVLFSLTTVFSTSKKQKFYTLKLTLLTCILVDEDSKTSEWIEPFIPSQFFISLNQFCSCFLSTLTKTSVLTSVIFKQNISSSNLKMFWIGCSISSATSQFWPLICFFEWSHTYTPLLTVPSKCLLSEHFWKPCHLLH